MYLARVSVGPRRSAEVKRVILDGIEDVLRRSAKVARSDIFMLLREHTPSDFRLNKKFIDENSSDLILIQLSYTPDTADEQPRADLTNEIFAQITKRLGDDADISNSDVLITLLKIPKQNQSSGIATFNWVSTAPKPIFKPRNRVGSAASPSKRSEQDIGTQPPRDVGD